MPTRLTLKTVNDELARLGRQERLAKAGNYFLFTGGAADEWLDRTVGVLRRVQPAQGAERADAGDGQEAGYRRAKEVNCQGIR
jgi:hypothetical protein